MEFKQLHPWRVDYEKAVHLQEALRGLLVLKKPRGAFRTVAGADISYNKRSNRFFAGVVVLKLNKSLEKIEEATAEGTVKFPYIPGFLSFREAPVLLKAFKKLKHSPDVILFDGQGIAHPRGFGLASHLGLILDKPSVGCAKSRLVGEFLPMENAAGSYSRLFYQQEVVGAALRTKTHTKPVFVSPGYKTNLAFSLRIVLRTCRGYRIPEPIRQAHLLVNKLRIMRTISV